MNSNQKIDGNLSRPGKILCAMSGGVDSSVSALLLKRRGYDVVGVSMQVWDYRQNGGCATKVTCCAPDDFTDARRCASTIDIPYYVFDFEETFREKVIDVFINSYRQGITPNPCVECNRKVKFKALRERAAALDISKVATGHYAQIEQRHDGFHLVRGVDSKKDQSYFLYAMTQNELAATEFPVGNLTKPEVRELAKEFDLATAEKAESQDVCFVSGKLRDFLEKMGVQGKAGLIVTGEGRVVGQHDGIHHFCVGQRRGLHVGGNAEPQYVLEIDVEANVIIVGTKRDLERESFTIENVNFCNSAKDEFTAIAQLRYRHPGVPVTVRRGPNDRYNVFFKDTTATVTPGQACVLYSLDNREVIGGGTILVEARICRTQAHSLLENRA